MSGGYFDYAGYHLEDILCKLENMVSNYLDLKKDSELDSQTIWNSIRDYLEENDSEFNKLFLDNMLKFYKSTLDAMIYERRFDWYLSGDDAEDSFKRRLFEDNEQASIRLKNFKNNLNKAKKYLLK